MAVELSAILKQIDNVLQYVERTKTIISKIYDEGDRPLKEICEAVTLLDSTIDRLAPPGSRYREIARSEVDRNHPTNDVNVDVLVGILIAFRQDYATGSLQSVQELVHANMFADFLEMAEYLLAEGYKDPAAVIIGGVLEEHLRKLCEKHNISVTKANGEPKKADALNSELAGANIYNLLDQKNVTAWLDLRNKAGHGKYTEYTKEQAALLLQSVRDFLSRLPA
jgi:hypothetical protein